MSVNQRSPSEREVADAMGDLYLLAWIDLDYIKGSEIRLNGSKAADEFQSSAACHRSRNSDRICISDQGEGSNDDANGWLLGSGSRGRESDSSDGR